MSELVLQEAAAEDTEGAQRRLSLLADILVIRASPEALELAKAFVSSRIVSAPAGAEALHIAIAAMHGVEHLPTWNCRHVANAQMRAKIEAYVRTRGLEPPILCTPEELMETPE